MTPFEIMTIENAFSEYNYLQEALRDEETREEAILTLSLATGISKNAISRNLNQII